jgi:hypothetical protein
MNSGMGYPFRDIGISQLGYPCYENGAGGGQQQFEMLFPTVALHLIVRMCSFRHGLPFNHKNLLDRILKLTGSSSKSVVLALSAWLGGDIRVHASKI